MPSYLAMSTRWSSLVSHVASWCDYEPSQFEHRNDVTECSSRNDKKGFRDRQIDHKKPIFPMFR